MKYRIVEFKEALATSATGDRFFIQIGTKTKKKCWFFHVNTVVWENVVSANNTAALGFATLKEAKEMIDELKKQEPIYHYIK